MPNLLIIGAGGHGKVVVETAELLGYWDKICFLDDNTEFKELLGYPVIGTINDFSSFIGEFQFAFVALGNNKLRIELIHKLIQVGFTVPTIIHPKSYMSKYSTIEAGSVMMAGSVVNASTKIGMGCIVNTCSSIDHDCYIEAGVHVSPGVHIAGHVRIGEKSWLCIGSSISNNVRIGNNVIVASNAAVIENIPDRVMVAGVPAKIKKQLEDE